MGKFTKFELLFAKNQSIVINIHLIIKNWNCLVMYWILIICQF